MVVALSKNRIISCSLNIDTYVKGTKILHLKGEPYRKFFRKGFYKNTLVEYNGHVFTIEDLAKYLGPISLYISKDREVRYSPQIVYTELTSETGLVKHCKPFNTNEEAIDFYHKFIEENNLEQIN